MILIDIKQEITLKSKEKVAKGCEFICTPITSSDMATYRDMTIAYERDKEITQIRINSRNHQIFKRYVKRISGLENSSGGAIAWEPRLIESIPVEVINDIANQLFEKNIPKGKEIKN